MCPPFAFWFLAGFGVMFLLGGLGLAAVNYSEAEL